MLSLSLRRQSKTDGKRADSIMMRKIKNRWQIYLMMLPAVAAVVIFHYVPMYGIIIAFKNYNFRDGIFGSPWVGLENFTNLFNSYWFWQSSPSSAPCSAP